VVPKRPINPTTKVTLRNGATVFLKTADQVRGSLTFTSEWDALECRITAALEQRAARIFRLHCRALSHLFNGAVDLPAQAQRYHVCRDLTCNATFVSYNERVKHEHTVHKDTLSRAPLPHEQCRSLPNLGNTCGLSAIVALLTTLPHDEFGSKMRPQLAAALEKPCLDTAAGLASATCWPCNYIEPAPLTTVWNRVHQMLTDDAQARLMASVRGSEASMHVVDWLLGLPKGEFEGSF
jgi:hypothetical protein